MGQVNAMYNLVSFELLQEQVSQHNFVLRKASFPFLSDSPCQKAYARP